MAALIDMSTGKASIAYTGEKPWHGLGAELSPGQTLEQWREAAGLQWDALEAPVCFRPGTDGEFTRERNFADKKVIYRSDTLAGLGVVGSRYQVVQPAQVVNFYDELCDRYGYAMETMGALKDGRVIWALAKTGMGHKIQGIDEVQAYLLLTTSFDGSSATQGKFTDVRVVCNNTLSMAMDKRGTKSVSVRHNTAFDAASVKADLGVGEIWQAHMGKLEKLAQTQIDPREQVDFLLKVYHDITSKSVDADKPNVERTMRRLSGILTQAPGATMPTAFGTLYGLVNAVTYDVDHSPRAHSDEGRMASAWMGAGDNLKSKALDLAVDMATTQG
jgi:phage/plasmid-like protein (TIGR03299 family)